MCAENLSRSQPMVRRFLLSLAFAALAGCAVIPPDRAAAPSTPAASRISLETLTSVDRELSSDRYEGRAPTTPGEELTVNYVAERFRQAGLQPGNHGSWFQEVPLAENTAEPTPLRIS